MPSFSDIIKQSGKGLDISKNLVYLLDINLGGTLGTRTYANIGRDLEGNFYKSKIGDSGAIHRSIIPETGEFEVSDLTLSLANGDLEFSKYPWNNIIINKHSILRLGYIDETGSLEYLADCSYLADGLITASCTPLGVGGPGDISVSVAYTLFKGIIKKEERSNKEFKLSIGDFTNKVFKDIPPRNINIIDFPKIGTSAVVLGTMTNVDTNLIGRGIPYIYGDFTDFVNLKPAFIDTFKNRYLVADHPIGTVSEVIVSGTQVYNCSVINAGLHNGTHILSYIDFRNSQGTKNVYIKFKGKVDSIRRINDVKDAHINPYNSGSGTSLVDLIQFVGTVGIGTYVSFGCYIKQHENNAGYLVIQDQVNGSSSMGTALSNSNGTWVWTTVSRLIGTSSGGTKVTSITKNRGINVKLRAQSQNTGVSFSNAKFILGTVVYPPQFLDGMGILSGTNMVVLSEKNLTILNNGDFYSWSNHGTYIGTYLGTRVGTRGPDYWTSQWQPFSVKPSITVGGTGITNIGRYTTNYGTLITKATGIIKDLLLNPDIGGLNLNDIGTASFDITEQWLSDYHFRTIIDSDSNYKNFVDFIHAFCLNTLSSFYFDRNNQANFSAYRPALSRKYLRKIFQNEIIEDSFNIMRDVKDIYNNIIINYNYDYINKNYKNAIEIKSAESIDKYETTSTFKIDSLFIHDFEEANYIARKWGGRLKDGINRVQFSVPIVVLPLDIGDRILVSHDEPSTVTGGWVNRLVSITDFEIDNKGKIINITGYDEDEVSIAKRYFILGNGTAFYRSASESQRYYGALSSSGGTMSNGDPGYLLW